MSPDRSSPSGRDPGSGGSGPPAIVSDLLRPEAYPPPAPGQIELRTTHGSWVFVTKGSVRKLKRPVDYGFLDYSTVDKRYHFCQAEVRLGRRLAPDVYLGVEPVFRTSAGHRLFGPGEVVDHVVHMRRLADADSASARLAAGTLGPAELDRLAERLARFYQEAPADRAVDAPGILAAAIEENRAQVRQLGAPGLVRQAADRVCDWQAGVLRRLTPVLRERVRQGRVRDGHGDLRLEHVYFEAAGAGDPLVIDPIEFNDGFRLSDVALDVAFFAMELEAAGRQDLSAFFLSSFAARTDDHGLFQVLDLYLSYRAFVRAKVAGFVAADPATPPEKARRKGEEAGRLLTLAEGFTRRQHTQAVIAIGGLPGVGKSTLAAAVGQALGLPVVSSDWVRKHLAGIAPEARGTPEIYAPAFTERTYAGVLARAEQVLRGGFGVVLDATFREPAWRLRARQLAADQGRPFLFVQAVCDEATVRARLLARAGSSRVSDADLGVYEQLRESFTAPDELAPGERTTADTRLEPGQAAERIADRLGGSDPMRTRTTGAHDI